GSVRKELGLRRERLGQELVLEALQVAVDAMVHRATAHAEHRAADQALVGPTPKNDALAARTAEPSLEATIKCLIHVGGRGDLGALNAEHRISHLLEAPSDLRQSANAAALAHHERRAQNELIRSKPPAHLAEDRLLLGGEDDGILERIFECLRGAEGLGE